MKIARPKFLVSLILKVPTWVEMVNCFVSSVFFGVAGCFFSPPLGPARCFSSTFYLPNRSQA